MQLTTDKIRELLDYNEETGVFTWKERYASSSLSNGELIWYKLGDARLEGTKAGRIHTNGRGYPRVDIKLFGKHYRASRLAFLWMGEELPEQVDHKDRDSTNNRWSNLAVSNASLNAKNQSMPSNNTSGVTGVSWEKRSSKWQAEVVVDGVRHRLGLFDHDDLDLAAMEVMEFRAEHGFSPSHGLQRAAYANG